MRIAAAGLAILIVGCVTTSEVVPLGNGTYKIAAGNDTCDCPNPLVLVRQQAIEYCSKQSRTMVANDTKIDSLQHGYVQHVTLTFSCPAGR